MRKSRQKTVSNLLEQDLISRGFRKIIGIDEVGRGAFAGPVYVTGFVYDIRTPFYQEVDDSKKLSLKKRLLLFPDLIAMNHVMKIGSVESINSQGIGKTIEGLVTEIVKENNSPDTYFLVDGYFKNEFDDTYKNLMQIKNGDNLHYSISCASIIAKVSRDNHMHKIGEEYPQYHFGSNVGYGTASHLEAIKEFGITRHHRTSFRPLSNLPLFDEQT